MILDLSRVSFIDSSGLRAVLSASNRLEAANGRLVVQGMSGAVERVFEITGLLERYRQ